jgi:hypothetical protein
MPDRNIAVEYQGEQHFIEISIFGGKEGLRATEERKAFERQGSAMKESGAFAQKTACSLLK